MTFPGNIKPIFDTDYPGGDRAAADRRRGGGSLPLREAAPAEGAAGAEGAAAAGRRGSGGQRGREGRQRGAPKKAAEKG